MKTKKTQVIILANSIRPGGRCIAGICVDTGKWIRPIPKKGEHFIPTASVSDIGLLDVVEIPFSRKPKVPHRYQIENRFVKSFKWRRVGMATKKEIRKYAENNGQLFHSDYDRVDPTVLKKLPTKDWRSLQLVETKARFIRDNYSRNRWRAEFKDGAGNLLSLKVTDPVATERLNKGLKYRGKILLTISLGQPWPSDGSRIPRCYKLVAAVIK